MKETFGHKLGRFVYKITFGAFGEIPTGGSTTSVSGGKVTVTNEWIDEPSWGKGCLKFLMWLIAILVGVFVAVELNGQTADQIFDCFLEIQLEEQVEVPQRIVAIKGKQLGKRHPRFKGKIEIDGIQKKAMLRGYPLEKQRLVWRWDQGRFVGKSFVLDLDAPAPEGYLYRHPNNSMAEVYPSAQYACEAR